MASLVVDEAIDAAVDIGRHLGRGFREKPTSSLLDSKLEKGGERTIGRGGQESILCP